MFRESGISGVFCDTSFFYASLEPRDINHSRARFLLEAAATDSVIFYSTWGIISETVTLLRYRCSHERALQFLDHVRPSLHLIAYDTSIQQLAEEVFRRFGRDKKLSLCDALSFVVVTVRLHHIPCLSFDSDFRQLGLTVLL
jgi:predicted nucleic acid-binding protein